MRPGTGTEIPTKGLLRMVPSKPLAVAQRATGTDTAGSPPSCSRCLEESRRSWRWPRFPGTEEAPSTLHRSLRLLASLRRAKPRWCGAGEDAACSKAGTEHGLRATGFVLIKEESIRLQDIQPPGASDYFFLLLLFFLNVLLLPPGKP